ncbi:glycosyltransferase family 4 protein [Halomonas sp. BC04]|uniref:glycosyltransferase family 4 protein n=1 Tax=Halomonas sp. BC04 TaxID=1403540 RepID=UPI0004AD10EB|nr:glycosyltransferase family 4 protein [Halomonas sp. BC04]
MRITIVISSLSQGGAERVVKNISDGFLQKGLSVEVVTLTPLKKDFYTLRDGVARHDLGEVKPSRSKLDSVLNNFILLYRLRRSLKKSRPDILLSFMPRANIYSIMASFFLNTPIVISERNNPEKNEPVFLWRCLRRFFYPYASHIVSLCQGVDAHFNYMPSKKRSIINPSLSESFPFCDNPGQGGKSKTVVAMGRLVPQKGFDLLIEAFYEISLKNPGWCLEIYGEGSEKDKLIAMIAELEMEERVLLKGLTDQPYEMLKEASIFVFSSRWEGFGNALVEAMGCGVPVISYDCDYGPREIIVDGSTGLLAKASDVADLSEKIQEIIDNPDLASKMAKLAVEDVKDRFSHDVVIDQWINLFVNVSGSSVVSERNI